MKKAVILLVLTISIISALAVSSVAAHPFTDVKDGAWYAAAVDYCYEKGLIAGTSATTFSPDMTLTRGMFVLMLARTVDNTYEEYTDVSFTDVKQSDWYATAVEWAYRNGISKGTSDTTFSPNAAITREQVCTLLYNYIKSKEISFDFDENALDPFVDISKISSWAKNGLIFAVTNTLVKGTSVSVPTLSPKMQITRSQAAQIFMAFKEILPKKYFTLSFDDGITQDLKIMEILRKYDVDCCTFMVNTEGLYGASWNWVGELLGKPEVTHQRFTEEELRTGIYNGFDVQCHTRTHPSLKAYDDDPDMITYEVQGNANDIADITGIMPTGMAWPGGDTEYTDKTIELVLENTDIKYARGINNSFSYKLPEYFMTWQPTCSVQDPYLLTYAKHFIMSEPTEDTLFYVWGHGYELDAGDLYDEFDKLIKMMSENEDIILVTNTEFYELYKNEIPCWK